MSAYFTIVSIDCKLWCPAAASVAAYFDFIIFRQLMPTSMKYSDDNFARHAGLKLRARCWHNVIFAHAESRISGGAPSRRSVAGIAACVIALSIVFRRSRCRRCLSALYCYGIISRAVGGIILAR